jgi:hypothetical protein
MNPSGNPIDEGDVMSTAFGIGSPSGFPVQSTPWSASPYGAQGIGSYSAAQLPYSGQQPILQSLQILPQQIQQLQQLAYIQQQQLQQVLQIVPAQLQQLQQVIQFVPQQLQQLAQLVAQQQFGGGAQGLTAGQMGQSQGFGAPLQTLSPFSPFAVSSGHVM